MKLALHRKTDLALHAMGALADAGSLMSGARLAERIDTTPGFLPHVLAPLVRAGWVETERGPGGGYRLSDAGAEARLLDVIEALEGPAVDGRCVLRDGPCPGEPECLIHRVWLEARAVLIDGLGEIPI